MIECESCKSHDIATNQESGRMQCFDCGRIITKEERRIMYLERANRSLYNGDCFKCGGEHTLPNMEKHIERDSDGIAYIVCKNCWESLP